MVLMLLILVGTERKKTSPQNNEKEEGGGDPSPLLSCVSLHGEGEFQSVALGKRMRGGGLTSLLGSY